MIRQRLRAVVDQVARKASRNYVAGPTLDDAQRVSRHLAERGYWVTQGYWDGVGDTPMAVQHAYLGALRQLADFGRNSYLSLKIPALQYNPAWYAAVLAESRQSGVALHFDSLAPEQADLMHGFIEAHTEPSRAGDIGCTLPGRWRRSVTDAERVADLGLNVRVVKGQWQDPDRPDTDPRAGFLAVIEALAGRARCVRVATHDPLLARAALTRLQAADTRCELELLYGLPVADLADLAADLKVPVRVYIAFGHAYLPYALASVRKHPGLFLKLVMAAYKRDYLASFPPCTSNRSG